MYSTSSSTSAVSCRCRVSVAEGRCAAAARQRTGRAQRRVAAPGRIHLARRHARGIARACVPHGGAARGACRGRARRDRRTQRRLAPVPQPAQRPALRACTRTQPNERRRRRLLEERAHGTRSRCRSRADDTDTRRPMKFPINTLRTSLAVTMAAALWLPAGAQAQSADNPAPGATRPHHQVALPQRQGRGQRAARHQRRGPRVNRCRRCHATWREQRVGEGQPTGAQRGRGLWPQVVTRFQQSRCAAACRSARQRALILAGQFWGAITPTGDIRGGVPGVIRTHPEQNLQGTNGKKHRDQGPHRQRRPRRRASPLTLADQGPIEIAQDDTFFRCNDSADRLKLRTFAPDRAELIFYRRAEQHRTEGVVLPDHALQHARRAARIAHARMGTGRPGSQAAPLIHRGPHACAPRPCRRRSENSSNSKWCAEEGESAEAGTAEAHALMSQLGISIDQLVQERLRRPDQRLISASRQP